MKITRKIHFEGNLNHVQKQHFTYNRWQEVLVTPF